ncbi:Tyrocidine synthase 3 [compost metagenome]
MHEDWLNAPALEPSLMKVQPYDPGAFQYEEVNTFDIAIIGLSMRMPQSENADSFWQHLTNGHDLIGPFPDLRIKDILPFLPYLHMGDGKSPSFSPGAYLHEIDKFDHEFFGISRREALLMSPSQRLFLETAAHALDDAGYGGRVLSKSKTGVYIGHNSDSMMEGYCDYSRLIAAADSSSIPAAVPGNLSPVIASRISYLLDLRGPSINIDTACSSSLVSIHMACQGIRSGDCDMAIAGSVKINLFPIEREQKLGIESSTYRARTFDNRADGTGRGEGVVAILLKPLHRALQDHDHIYSVIKGSAINQDGLSIGITAPNAIAQAEVIASAWEQAGIDPQTISYIEAHGTGTSLGDPIEIDGIQRAFAKYTNRSQFCAVGALKTNIGHLDNAAGIASFTKTVMALYHKELPPSLHLERPNHKISFEQSPVYLLDRLTAWETDNDSPRRAGISSFGLSGTNCHFVLEEAPDQSEKCGYSSGMKNLLTLSSRSESSLIRTLSDYHQHLAKNPQIHLTDLCFTASVGRGHYNHRIAMVVTSYEEALQALQTAIASSLQSGKLAEGIYYGISTEQDSLSLAKESRDLLMQTERFAWDGDAYEELADLYARGANPDWEEWYSSRHLQPYRIPLPCYSFNKERFWIGDLLGADKSANVQLTGNPENRYTDAQYKIAQVMGEVLGRSSMDLEDDLYVLGGDSLAASQIINTLNHRYSLELDISSLLRMPKIGEFAAFVEQSQAQASAAPLDIGATAPLAGGVESGPYRASPAQERLYVLQQMNTNATHYNMPEVIEVSGYLDKERFQNSMESIIARHETLRTSFHIEEAGILQSVHPESKIQIAYENLGDSALEEHIQSFIRPFDLSDCPLIRIKLLSAGAERHFLLFDMHHIISDGTSMGVLIKEFIKLYNGQAIPDLKWQYRDYVNWFYSHSSKKQLQSQEYWRTVFDEELPLLQLPTDHARPTTKTYRGDKISFRLDESATCSIRDLAKQTHTTVFQVVLSAFAILLSRYSNQEDLVIGTPVAGRQRSEWSSNIGMFVNTLALRLRPKMAQNYRVFLEELKDCTHDAFTYQEYPFEKLVELLNVPRDTGRNPVFDVMIVHQNVSFKTIETEELELRAVPFQNPSAKVDLTLEMEELESELELRLEFALDLFQKETILRMAGHLEQILDTIPDNLDRPIGHINMILPEEERLVLHTFNQTSAPFPDAATLHKSIEEQAARTPDKTAVRFEASTLTYRELNERANQLAHALRRDFVTANPIVPLIMERSIDMPVVILAVLKAGGAYLPIDPSHPQERIRFILQDSGCTSVIVQERFAHLIPDDLVKHNLDQPTWLKESSENFAAGGGPDDLAYIIYTSGSTGNPKGVMIEHKSVLNRLAWMQRKYPLGADDVILQKTPYTFDVSVWEIFWALLEGASICYLVPGGEKNPQQIIDAVVTNDITVMHFVPSMLHVFLEYLESTNETERLTSLRQIFVSGEALTISQTERFHTLLRQRLGTQLANLYGPTEATVDVSYYDVIPSIQQHSIPIGRPIQNTALYVLGPNDLPQPVGVPGELHISGIGLARGYLNLEELTNQKFVPNPFIPNSLMYRTGDLARWLPDGNIEYLGRIDHQVKVRGYRIELDEIQFHLLQHPAIQECIVLVREDQPGNPAICAYYLSETELTAHELKAHLEKLLPPYMIPGFFVHLEQFPVTSNGKLDRRSLPRPEKMSSPGTTYEAPGSHMEQVVAGIWQDVLKMDNIGIHDHFFEVGGNSILLVQVFNRIQQVFPGRITMTDLFAYPTIHQLVQYLEHDLTISDSNQDSPNARAELTDLIEGLNENTDLEGILDHLLKL